MDRGSVVTALDNKSRGCKLDQFGVDTPKYNWYNLYKKKGMPLINASVAEADSMEKFLCEADAVILTAC